MKQFNLIPIASRSSELRHKMNEMIYNISNVNNMDKVLFLIEKGIGEVLAPWQYKIMQFEKRIQNFSCLQSYNQDRESYISAELQPHIDRAFKADTIVFTRIGNRNVAIIPLQSPTQRIGYMTMNDDGELPFTKHELTIMRNVKQHLAALIVRLHDYQQITQRIEKMNQLMSITHELMRIVNISDLEHEIVSACIDFTNSTRGY